MLLLGEIGATQGTLPVIEIAEGLKMFKVGSLAEIEIVRIHGVSVLHEYPLLLTNKFPKHRGFVVLLYSIELFCANSRDGNSNDAIDRLMLFTFIF